MGRVLRRATGLAGAFAAGAAAAHLAGVPRLARLTADLQRSREEILANREEERRRLRRDLHDGLGPTLASLAMSLEAARLTMAHEPERVEPLLSELRDQLTRSVGDLRDLTHGLRPPALDDLGLVAAIESVAAGCCDRVDVRFDGDPTDLPAATEVAAFHIVREALANVRRHSRAATARVLLTRGTDLSLMVADSGTGLPDPVRNGGQGRGGGLAAMREWAAELGGTCTVSSRTGGGTVVTARLPLAVPRYHRSPAERDGRT
ncbi:sensor histidine kinase [Actinomadura xylanilytica]|uniref:sensor histidine kinase n=1 Tax=Actinomadura xylanilytica TaxID=887459 RepID=UPI00255B3335|nr:histidine kinase [Actinomadura xylanilytica]MDL4777766.1 histidine kinase [Actinomadura xylanilytica]